MTHDRIVVGVDDSDAGTHALRWALAEAVRRGATLVAVTAWPGHHDRPGPADPGRTAELAALLDHQRDRIDRACAGLALPYHPVICQEVVPGDPISVLARQCRDADLVVVGTDRHGGMGVSSVAGRLAARMRHPGVIGGRCAVVAVPAPAHDRTSEQARDPAPAGPVSSAA